MSSNFDLSQINNILTHFYRVSKVSHIPQYSLYYWKFLNPVQFLIKSIFYHVIPKMKILLLIREFLSCAHITETLKYYLSANIDPVSYCTIFLCLKAI